MLNRYSRQILFPGIGSEGQIKLSNSKVAVVGVGALGTVILNNLVRAGVGYIRIIDRDFVEMSNLQRQTLFDELDAAGTMPKAEAAAGKLRQINGEAILQSYVVDFNSQNALELFDGIDLVIDGTDNFETRFVINDACIKLQLPWIYGGCVGSSGMTAVIIPGVTACLRCMFDSPPASGIAQTCDTVGIINSASGMVASLQSAEALKILIGADDKVNRGLISFDLWENRFDNFDISGARLTDCVCCGRKHFEYLERSAGTQTSHMCGRNAVQVLPAGSRANLDFGKLEEQLQKVGNVSWNQFLLRFTDQKYELVLFKDGRAIVKGTDSESVAKGLYARYFGL